MRSWLTEISLRIKALFQRKRLDRELEEEMAFHLAMLEEANRARGANAEEARHQASRRFGNVTRMKEVCREMWSFTLLEGLWRDLRYGARALGKNPGFTAAAVLAIALGIGVNTCIFSVLNGVALKLLPVPKAAELVSINQILRGKVYRNVHGEPGLFSYPEYRNYRENNHVFSGLLAYAPFLEATLGGESPKKLMGAETSCNFFEVLGERPALGRTFVDEDCRAPGASAVVVLSDDLWRKQFGGDPAVIGKTVSLNRARFTVIGIAAPGFHGIDPWPNSFWAPVTMQKALEPDRDLLNEDNTGWLALLGRVEAGVSIGQVRSDLSVIAGHIDQQYPKRITTLVVHPATFMGRPDERSIVFAVGTVVLAAVGLVLLIACANVANLLLARASTRRKEIAIRLSIGGSRWQIVRQLLTESILISLIGGTLGSLVAFSSLGALSRLVLSHLPPGAPQLFWDVSPDLRVWAYSLTLTVVTGIVFGLAPALHATRQELSTVIKGDGGEFIGKAASGGKLRSTLVAVQVAVCMVLLIAAGLLMRGLYSAQTVDPGFEMSGITQTMFDLSSQGYNRERAQAFQRELQARVAALPGVDAVEQARVTPLGQQFMGTGLTLEGETESRRFEFNVVSAGYFAMLGMPIVRGRAFTTEETQAGARVLVVTQSTAQQLWPGQDAIGKVLRNGEKEIYQVVGVVKDAQVSHLGQTGGLFFYQPAGPKEQESLQLLVHSRSGDRTAANGVREAVRSLDADLIVEVTKLEDNLELWRAPSRIVAALSGVLGAMALLLASIGVYGVVSYSVSRRIHEIGVRMTLGANGKDVIRLVLRQALRPVVIGALVGVAGCAAVSQVLSKVLYGIGSHDPVAFVGVPLFLLGISLLASYFPARRAARIDPAVALRYE
ncbi:MAG TPA: ABC transporter permease [Candidatus Angelobacter sp.]|nr:ABC transporter permease [Candidatus Angelobacter sp.]